MLVACAVVVVGDGLSPQLDDNLCVNKGKVPICQHDCWFKLETIWEGGPQTAKVCNNRYSSTQP